MQRVIFVLAGLVLAGYSLYLIVALCINGKMLTLALLLAPLLAALALGTMLVIRGVKKQPEDSEVGGQIP